MDDSVEFVALSADVVSAYVSNNSVSSADLPALITSVHTALCHAAIGVVEEAVLELKPAVSVKRSVTADYIISLENGQKFKSLKRHLQTKYGLSPDEYRAKWSLPSDYPMTAPNYAATRSALAKKLGLGQQRSRAAAPAKAVAPIKAGAKTAAAPAKRGRKAAA